MEVFYKGVSRIRLVLPVAESAPGLYATITNEDGTVNSAAMQRRAIRSLRC